MNIKPTGNQVAVQFLDDEDEEAEERGAMASNAPTSDESYNELCYAICVGVGPEAQKGIKKGDALLVKKYARSGAHIDDVYLIDSWAVSASISV